MWDRTVLLATRHKRTHPALTPASEGWYLIYLPQRDGRLSWPRWLDYTPTESWTHDRLIEVRHPNHCATKTPVNMNSRIFILFSLSIRCCRQRNKPYSDNHILRHSLTSCCHYPRRSLPCRRRVDDHTALTRWSQRCWVQHDCHYSMSIRAGRENDYSELPTPCSVKTPCTTTSFTFGFRTAELGSSQQNLWRQMDPCYL